LLHAFGAGALAAAAAPLAGCGGSDGRTTIRFLMNKPEVVDHFARIVADFNAGQRAVHVVLDTTPVPIIPQFARGEPPDIACYNYRAEAALFTTKGVLSDLGDLPEAASIAPAYRDLAASYGTYRGETNVLPFSITAAGTIYNPRLFAEHDVAVPRTWSELVTACETFAAAGITPVYSTHRVDGMWALTQGLFDYVAGSTLDVATFFRRLDEAGPAVSAPFTAEFGPAVRRMIELRRWFNPDADTRTYYDGNLAFGDGRAAMYLQGPWALGEIAKVDPAAPVATFPLPATDDPARTTARVNVDLGVWIPRSSRKQEAARAFLSYLFRPEVVNSYNAANLAYSPLRGAPAQPDPRLAGLQPAVDANRIQPGASTFVTDAIPLGSYLQEALQTGDDATFLRRLDTDWQRLAARSA
jgi:raffinose/stachyose/melibiose transport system substrate-binding protein